MGQFQSMVTIKDKVKLLLEKRPDTRHSDNVLIAQFWAYEDISFFKEEKTAMEFLTAFSEGKFTSPETIRRVRQKLQETVPALRGDSYVERKKQAQEVKQNIHNL